MSLNIQFYIPWTLPTCLISLFLLPSHFIYCFFGRFLFLNTIPIIVLLKTVTKLHGWIFKTLSISFPCFPGGSEVKASARNAGDLGLIPGSGRSPGEGNGNPLQYSCLENPMDGGAWWATVHRVAKSRIRLSYFTSLQPPRTSVLLFSEHCVTHLISLFYISLH